MGFSEGCVTWFQSYLSERIFFVSIENQLSHYGRISCGVPQGKSILFAGQRKIKTIKKLNIEYQDIEIKQHSQVTYLGCVMDETMSGEAMALKVVNKINEKLKFLYRKNSFLTPGLRRMLCNALIQPHLDYACST